ncbi:hypothetical protein RhoFasK5_02237|nr:hypothetical protein [Rhodococcus kroppenstedtii]
MCRGLSAITPRWVCPPRSTSPWAGISTPWPTSLRGRAIWSGAATGTPPPCTPSWWCRRRTATSGRSMRTPSAPPASPPPCRSRSTSPNDSSTTPSPCAIGCRGCSSACATGWSPPTSSAPSSRAPNSSTVARIRGWWTPTSLPHCARPGRGPRRGCGICAIRWCTAVIPMPSANGGRKRSRGGASSPRPVSTAWERWGRRCPPNAPPSSLVSSRDWPRRCAGTTVAPRVRGHPMRCSRWSSTPRSAATAAAPSVRSRWSMRTKWRRPRHES